MKISKRKGTVKKNLKKIHKLLKRGVVKKSTIRRNMRVLKHLINLAAYEFGYFAGCFLARRRVVTEQGVK